MHELAPLAVTLPIVVACLLLAVGRWLPRLAVDIVATAGALSVVGLLAALWTGTGSGRVVTWLGGWTPVHGHSVGVVFVVDRFGCGTALLAAALMTAALVFSWSYFEDVDAHFQCLMLLFLAGMVGFSVTGDLFDMFVFFELMGAVAYALTGFKIEDGSSLQGGLNFGIINSLGAYITLTGIAMLYARTGELGLAQIGTALHGHHADALVVVSFVLVITGWLVKAALAPFHFWLADAHAVAPTPVCVLFSGVMVELGLYGVLRFYWTSYDGVLPAADVRRVLLVLGVVSAVVGAAMCLAQRHIKRLLAFSTIAHVGLFACAAATLDAPGTAGAALYVVGHAGVKSALFLLAGVLLNRYGSVDEVSLMGRGRERPLAGVLFGLAGLGLAGLPPFGTGLGKGVGEEALAAAGFPWATALFVAVSALTGGAVLRVAGRVFLGWGQAASDVDDDETSGDDEEPETESQAPERVRVTMLLPVVALLVASVLVGTVPGVARAVGAGAVAFVDHHGYVAQALSGAAGGTPPAPEEVGWTASGVVLGVLSALLALAVAAAGLWGQAGVRLVQRRLSPVVRGLDGIRRLHSGHVGDYVTWLLVGVAGLVALVGLPLRH